MKCKGDHAIILGQRENGGNEWQGHEVAHGHCNGQKRFVEGTPGCQTCTSHLQESADDAGDCTADGRSGSEGENQGRGLRLTPTALHTMSMLIFFSVQRMLCR